MSDMATAGSVVAEQPPAGTPAAPPASGVNGSAPPADSNNQLSGLSEGTRKLIETKGYKSPEDIAKAYINMEQKFGSMLAPPAPDAPAEEWAKVYSKLGRPESPDKYEFKRPEGLPADITYSDELAKAAKPWMHEAGLNPKQAQSVHDKFVGYVAQQEQARRDAIVQAVQQTHDVLVKDWGGPPDSPAFKEKLTLADRALKKLGLADGLKKAGVLLPDGSLTDPQIAKAFATVGEAMFREDTIDGSVPGATGENPFKRDPAGHIKSPSAISALIKSDPERAKRLAREAGEPLENWFSANPL